MVNFAQSTLPPAAYGTVLYLVERFSRHYTMTYDGRTGAVTMTSSLYETSQRPALPRWLELFMN